ncbi:HORMA domain-containing protein 1-like isoform X2 [Homarus americanus]|uniref:HORMA domain-containing protein 1-like isoform X2 n=1 Tax=Homarus americanus TaxID=6706 RepID=UPI001C462E7C|nr:HORMA domain-containing protein 1-like isoform X2 [Homarus americanus]
MSLAQLTKLASPTDPDVITDMWSSLFTNRLGTVSLSTLAIKQLLTVTISTITYLRSLFPEAVYCDKVIQDINLKILKRSGQHIAPHTFMESIEGCYEAIEKQYLREMQLIIYEHDPDNPLEIYTFNLSYFKDGSSTLSQLKGQSIHGEKSFILKMPIMKMLRKVILMLQSFVQLPETVIFGFKLFYYDDVTPADYDPAAFMPVIDSRAKFSSAPTKVKVSMVQSTFHSVRLGVTTSLYSSNAQKQVPSMTDSMSEKENILPSSTAEPDVHRSLRGMSSTAEPDVHRSLRGMSSTAEPDVHRSLRGMSSTTEPDVHRSLRGMSSTAEPDVHRSLRGMSSTAEPDVHRSLRGMSSTAEPDVHRSLRGMRSTAEPDVHRSLRGMSSTAEPNVHRSLHGMCSTAEPDVHRSLRGMSSTAEPDVHRSLRDHQDSDKVLASAFTSTKQSSPCLLCGTRDLKQCPCLRLQDDPMIICAVCRCHQHGICFQESSKLLEKDKRLKHTCGLYYDNDAASSSSVTRTTNFCQKRETSLFRRLLVHLRGDESYHTPATVARLLQVNWDIGKRLMVRLQSEGVLAAEPHNDPRGRLVDQKMLRNYVIPYVFGDQLAGHCVSLSGAELMGFALSSFMASVLKMSVKHQVTGGRG